MSGTIRGRVPPVLVGAAVIAGAANVTAYAANGHARGEVGPWPSGQLRTAQKSAPFAVNSGTVVTVNSTDAPTVCELNDDRCAPRSGCRPP